MLDQQIECYINRSKLYRQIKRINRSIVRSADQILDQQTNVKSTDQMLDQQILT